MSMRRRSTQDGNGTRPLHSMIPILHAFADRLSSKMQFHAVVRLSHFVPRNCQSLSIRLGAFNAVWFKHSLNDHTFVRWHDSSFSPAHAYTALEACEFWLAFAEDRDQSSYLHSLLAKIASVLLDSMAYSEDDLRWLDTETNDAAVPEADIDIQPRHYNTYSHRRLRDNNPGETPKHRVGI